ncbi:MAG: hypothetical protein QNJ62_11930 [Methyloceanibacter sp.]|nr:hypothetical protein [Methyloceanibacter sp.]
MKTFAVIAIALGVTVGLTAVPASAKTKDSNPRVETPMEQTSAKNCERGTVAPFKRHPGHKNRGFLKGRC